MQSEIPTTPHPEPTKSEGEDIPVYNRIVLWMFLISFAFFGVIRLRDFLLAIFRWAIPGD